MCLSDPLSGYFPNENKECMKFKIGDVVRVKSFEQIKREFPNLEANGVCFCTYKGKYDMSKFCGKLVTLKKHEHDGLFTIEESNGGCNWADDFLEPFDGFRVGDTVFTVKRGMGKIYSDNWIGNTKERPFAVKFGEYCFQPKLSNLIPTEAKYKEAMTGGFAVDVAFVMPYNPTRQTSFLAKMRREAQEALDKLSADIEKRRAQIEKPIWVGFCDNPLASEIKVGDAVFYNGQKWEVVGIKQRDDNPCLLPHIKYDIHRQVTPNGGVGACVNESDLRLWKETKITHVDNCDPISSYGNINNDKGAMSKLKYIGKHLNGKDMFLQDAGNGKSVLWYGEKGDDC